MNKRLLFLCGILGPVAFLLNDIIGGIVTPNYSYIENTISDLTKAGTQGTYLFGSIILLISALMGIAFGIGIISRFKYKHAKPVFLGGLFLVIIGIFTGLTGTIFPQDPIGQELTFPGTMHIVLVGISLILTFPALLMIGIGLNKAKGWKSFRSYTFFSVLISFIFGGISVILAVKEIALLGLVERVSVYTIQVWIVVLACKFIAEDMRFQRDLITNSSD
ncbi:MAG: DUF998 domain-containing protein [candidate division WOR-3 bacterium]|nr:MAG: DUF998 domain-containing protein [candidate division WOR-3 bacterium]